MKVLNINRIHKVAGGADRVYLNTYTLLSENKVNVSCFASAVDGSLQSDFSRYFVSSFETRIPSIYGKIRVFFKYLYNLEAKRKLSELIVEQKPDIAHVHLFYGVLSSSILSTLKKYNVPIVATIHDYRLLCPSNAFLDKNFQVCERCVKSSFINCSIYRCSEGNFFQSLTLTIEAYIRKYIIKPINYIDHFIFVSEFSFAKHQFQMHQLASKSTVLFNFSDEISVKKEYHFGDYLFYYGRLSEEKGVLNLIKAVKELGIKLKIAGIGPLLDRILSEIADSCNIEYLGMLNVDEINTVIKNSAFVIVPSEWYENNPMTVIESFSLGKPVIASRIGGIPEIVNFTTGYLFEAGVVDSMKRTILQALSIDKIAYDNMSGACILFSLNNFDKTQHFSQLLKIYNSVLDDTKSS